MLPDVNLFSTSSHTRHIGHGSQSVGEKVFALIASSGERGRTCDEVEAILRRPHQTVSARVRELVVAGRIYDCGERRATRSYIIAQNRKTGEWGCSCRGYTMNRQCKHLGSVNSLLEKVGRKCDE